MKTFNAFLIVCATLFAACNNSQPENKVEATDPTTVSAETPAQTASTSATFAINKDLSVINWKGGNKFTPKAHAGTIQFSEGTLVVTETQLSGGKFVADMNSMNSAGDEYTDGAAKVGNLIGHLKSADFFDVANFPTATFEITGVKVQADASGATHQITGNLTIKGITKQITFPATVMFTGNDVNATATFTIDRSQWEVKYGSESFFPDLVKDKLIKNEIELSLNLSGTVA